MKFLSNSALVVQLQLPVKNDIHKNSQLLLRMVENEKFL